MTTYTLDFEDTGERRDRIPQVRVFCTCGHDETHNGVFSAWAMGDVHAHRHLIHGEPVTVQFESGPVSFTTPEDFIAYRENAPG